MISHLGAALEGMGTAAIVVGAIAFGFNYTARTPVWLLVGGLVAVLSGAVLL